MPEILGFSPRVFEEVRRFLHEERPVYRLEQLREADLTSPPVRILEGRCLSCGFGLVPEEEVFPADLLRSVRMTHAYDQKMRSQYCGGTVFFVTEPVDGLVHDR